MLFLFSFLFVLKVCQFVLLNVCSCLSQQGVEFALSIFCSFALYYSSLLFCSSALRSSALLLCHSYKKSDGSESLLSLSTVL